MPTPPLAHLGHWYLWILYAVPALIVFGATAHSAWAQRKARREEDATKG